MSNPNDLYSVCTKCDVHDHTKGPGDQCSTCGGKMSPWRQCPEGFEIVPGMWGDRPVPEHVATAYYISGGEPEEFDAIKAELKGE